MSVNTQRKPPWLKVRVAEGAGYRSVRRTVTGQKLHTVCQEARCPNVGECWGAGTATFLLLGDVCTRGCGFCAVTRGNRPGDVDDTEPRRVSEAVRSMQLRYAVLTSVTRDDLPDGGAGVFASTLHELAGLPTPPRTEVLVPDYAPAPLQAVLEAAPDVLAHNLEVVERLTPTLRHPRFSYRRSLEVLRQAAASRWRGVVKSSLLLGLGERDEEIRAAMEDLLAVGVEVLVLGQYLPPSRRHAPVTEYVPPERFDAWAEEGRLLGFGYVAAGPLVRTSYRAAEAYLAQRRNAG